VTEERILSDRYRLLRHIARGGMADVWEAEDQLLNRRVAVKMLHPQFARDEAFVSRFRKEAQNAANLTHPNIVAIYDWGEEGDTYFMVMELIDGRTLRDVLRSEGAFLARRAVEIAAESAAALTVAHEAGVFHRDVKSGNILLTSDGSVKVTDFGIARALDDSEELTKTGAVIGTATYFSPEQAQGLPADGRSDIYSLGVVLFELVTGQPPFSGESPVAVAYQHVSELAPPASSINPDVPAALETIIEKCLEKDPASRYQTAIELRNDLLRFLRGENPIAAPAAAPPPLIPVGYEPQTPIEPTPQHDAATQVIHTAYTANQPPPPPTATPDEVGRHVSYPPPQGEKESQLTYILMVVGLVAVLALGLFFLSRVMSPPEPVVAEVVVPSLAGQADNDAFATLQELDLKVRRSLEFSANVDAGLVIKTNPAAGERVLPGTLVEVSISKGEQTDKIPSLVDQNIDDAKRSIVANGFVVGTITIDETSGAEEGTVLRQSPLPATDHPAGTSIDLVVSGGPFAVLIPDVTNMTEESATLTLNRAGFSDIQVVEEFSLDVPENLVIRSEPGADNLQDRKRPVVIVLSLGPEPFALPDFVGLTVQDAQNLASQRGLTMILDTETVEVTAASGLGGLIASQDVAKDTEVRAGDTITLTLGVLIQVAMPNLMGMTVDDARSALALIGLQLEVLGDSDVAPDSGLVGLIADQIPNPGDLIDDGTTVGVWIGVLPPTTTTSTTTTTTSTTTTTAP